MRKDKLDEIKNILNYEYEIYFLKGNEVIPYHKITKENLKWLIEQAKRVQELEEENKRHRQLIYFLELKLDDFEKSAHMISRLTDEKLIERDAKALKKDIEGTMEVMEDER